MEAIRNAARPDFDAILSLNDTEVQHTSPMSLERLRLLVEMASYCKVATFEGQVVAFLIALQDGAPYENDNYSWFASIFLGGRCKCRPA
jgi:predicted GNAT superfamily acetyltransferase